MTKSIRILKRFAILGGRQLHGPKIISFKMCCAFEHFVVHSNLNKSMLRTKEHHQIIHQLHNPLQGMYVNTNPGFLDIPTLMTWWLVFSKSTNNVPELDLRQRVGSGDICKDKRFYYDLFGQCGCWSWVWDITRDSFCFFICVHYGNLYSLIHVWLWCDWNYSSWPFLSPMGPGAFGSHHLHVEGHPIGCLRAKGARHKRNSAKGEVSIWFYCKHTFPSIDIPIS